MSYPKLKEESYRNLGGINTISSLYTTEQTQFLDLRNYCFIRPGSLTNRPGQEVHASLSRATFLVKPSSSINFVKQDGSSYTVFDCGPTLFSLPSTSYQGGLTPNATTSAVLDHAVLDDKLFLANGNTFKIFDGSNSYNYTSERIRYNSGNAGVTFNLSLIPTDGQTVVLASGGYHFFSVGARGPASLITQYGELGSNPGPDREPDGVVVTLSATVVGLGRWVMFGMTLPGEYGYSAVAVEYQKGTSLSRDPYSNFILNTIKSENNYALNLSTYGGAVTVFGIVFDHFTMGAEWESQYRLTTSPRYLEVYNNMMFCSGFTVFPNQVIYSEVGEPERIKEENFFDIKTVDNKPISGMIFFQDSLVIFKTNSIHELTGTSPSDLTLRTTTLEYGALNNECLVVFENRLWFVDEKGICEYNAANTKIVSEPITSYLDQVDKTKIKAINYKDRNEVWFCAENKCFVYDYFANAWTIYDNVPIDRESGAAALPFGSSTIDPAYWSTGTSFLNFNRFNPTLSDDFGVAMTLIAKTRYHKRTGETSQEIWRRLYLNADVPSVTVGVTINFRPDYGTGVSLVRSQILNEFQERLDFGVQGKSMSVEFIIQALSPIRINGYTLESRYLRSV